MDEDGSPRTAFGASQKKDETKAYLRMLHAGQKRTIRYRSPERDSDEDILDVEGDTPSSRPSTPRGVLSRGFPEAPQDRQSGSQQFRKVVVHWTDASRMALIEEVSKRRNLWDITSAAYKDKQQSDEDWHHVREELNATFDSCYEVDEVKKQWKNLRDSFQKRMKAAMEPKTGSTAGDPPTKWIFFEAMQFLLEFNDEEPTMSNVGPRRYSSGAGSSVQCATSESRSGSNSPAPLTLGFRAGALTKTGSEKKKGEVSKATVLSRICDELGTMNQSQAGDQFDAFGAFAASTLRSIAASDEEEAKWAVLELTENLTKLVRESMSRSRRLT